MRVYILYIIVIISCLSACSATKKALFDSEAESKAIRLVLEEQQSAWNEGNIELFMQGYWNSKQLSFIGSKGVTRGWTSTLENYKIGYPDKATMGMLHFDIIEIKVLAIDAAYMIGKYTLTRATDTPSGYFNLLWRKVDGKWLIVSDYTSG